MKRLLALLAAAAALIVGLVVVIAPTPANAGFSNIGSLSAAPDQSNLGTPVTITPSAPCPVASTEAHVFYVLDNNEPVDDNIIPVGAGGTWTDVVTMDAAGDYFLDAECSHGGTIDGIYTETEFHVNGLVTAAPNPATSGDNVTFSPTFTDPADGSRCPGGAVTITITDPDGAAVVTNATPTVAGDGSWALAQILTKVGTYAVTGTCHRELSNPTPAAAHLAAAQVPTFTNDFTYSGTATVQAATTTTTTTVPSPAAEAVEATPTFTG